MIKQFYLILVAIGLLALTSCTNDSVEDLSDDSEEDTILMEEEHKALSVVNAFCNPVMDGDNIVGYTPKIGKQLDGSSPTVYSIECVSLADVHKIINSFFFPLLDDNTDNLLPVSDLKSFGKIIYSEGQNGTIAQIKIDMPLLPNVKEINFISKDDWPENDVQGSPYGVGDVVVSSDRTEAYICVRACSGGLPGLLIGCKEDIEKKNIITNLQNFDLPVNYIKRDGLNALAYMYFCYPNKLCRALEIIIRKLKLDSWRYNKGITTLYFTANKYEYYLEVYPSGEIPYEDLYPTGGLILDDTEPLDSEYRIYNILKQDNEIIFCTEGYDNTHNWKRGFFYKTKSCSYGEYYAYDLKQDMKNDLPVFRERVKVTWDRESTPTIYNKDSYRLEQKTFNEFDTQYQVVELEDFEDENTENPDINDYDDDDYDHHGGSPVG